MNAAMKKANSKLTTQRDYESLIKQFNARWPAWIALVVVAILYEALPPIFYWGPRGLMISLVVILITPMIITFWRSNMRLSRYFGLSVIILVTIYMIISIIRLIIAVLKGYIGPQHLLTSALALWSVNILIFALWYWSLDAGGQTQREAIEGKKITAFLFPQAQMSLMQTSHVSHTIKQWQPHFIDYLFLAFNTSTAFSPTDTPVLSRWAKCMSMVQAIISLTIVIMLAARAVNILNPVTNYLVT
jgi:hypothetical protein